MDGEVAYSIKRCLGNTDMGLHTRENQDISVQRMKVVFKLMAIEAIKMNLSDRTYVGKFFFQFGYGITQLFLLSYNDRQSDNT